jgi:NAD(P)-dependent dehydrogenase (short-subunit alcohol dehydrogenase family)
MRMLAQLAEALAPGARVAVLTSVMGSIGGRSNGNGWLYRASKAAANSVVRDAAFALAGRATVVSLHPGWVRTDMGGSEADLAVDASVAGMRRVIDALQPAASGGFFNHDGAALPW